MKRNGFTLAEVIIVVLMVSLITGFIYRMMSGTFSQYAKSQTKLSNLRAASLVIERIKDDLRSAMIPDKDNEPVIETSSMSFKTYNKVLKQSEVVKYSFDAAKGTILRQLGSEDARSISKVKVASFSVTVTETENNGPKLLCVSILVDSDKDLETRSEANRGNMVKLQTELYPRYYNENLSEEERYWNLAREASL